MKKLYQALLNKRTKINEDEHTAELRRIKEEKEARKKAILEGADFAAGMGLAMDEIIEKTGQWGQVGHDVIMDLRSSLSNFLSDLVLDTRNAFKNLGRNLLQTFMKVITEMAMQYVVVPMVLQPVTSGLQGMLGGTGTGFNMPGLGGIGNLIPDSIMDTALFHYGGTAGFGLGASSVTPMTAGIMGVGQTATNVSLGSMMAAAGPYLAAAGVIYTLFSSGILDSLFGDNAGFGFQTPEATGGFGQMPWSIEDFWVAEGSNGTSMEEMSELTTQLYEGIKEVIEATADQLEGYAALLPREAGKRLKESLAGLEINFPQWGVNEENYQEMIEGILQFAGDEMKRVATPVIAEEFAKIWGTMDWLETIPALSDDNAVRKAYENMLGLYQKMQAEVEAYGQVTVGDC